MTVDYDPLPFTQGVITSIVDQTLTIQLLTSPSGGGGAVGGGYNDANMIDFSKTDKIEIYDPTTMELSAPTYYSVRFEKVDDTTVRAIKPFVTSSSSSYGMQEKVGDVAVIKTTNLDSGRSVTEHAIRITGCTGLVMDSVQLYASTMFGFFETDCTSSTYRNCAVDRRPLQSDLYQNRPIPRMRSITADAFHSKHAVIGPTYDGIVARYNGDDGIAINGHYHLIMKSTANVLRVVGKLDERPNIEVGDPVEIVSRTGRRVDNDVSMGGNQVVVTDIQAATDGDLLTTDESTFLLSEEWHLPLAPKQSTASQVWYITVDRNMPDLPLGSLIASSNRIGNGFRVINSTVGPNRSRGILVKASQGIINDNTLIDNWGHAIMASPEYLWLEAGSGSNIRIQNNMITGCRDVAIAVTAKAADGSWAPTG